MSPGTISPKRGCGGEGTHAHGAAARKGEHLMRRERRKEGRKEGRKEIRKEGRGRTE